MARCSGSLECDVNGPYVTDEMYKLKPYFASDVQMAHCNVMYKMKNFHETKQLDETPNSVDASDPVAVLTHRQDVILKRLGELRMKVKRLQNQYEEPRVAITCGIPAPSVKQSADPVVAAIPQMGDVILDIVISANPKQPPLSLFVQYELLRKQIRVLGSSYVHSSVVDVGDNLRRVFNGIGDNRGSHQVALSVVWKNVDNGPIMMVTPHNQTPIEGEASIARYITRLLDPGYDTEDIVKATQIDEWLDTASVQLLRGNAKEKAAVLRSLNSRLGRNDWLVGSSLSLADIVMWSALHQSGQVKEAPANVKKWLKVCNQNSVFSLAQTLI